MSYANFQEAFLGSTRKVLHDGVTVSPRGQETKELLHHNFVIRHPERRISIVPARKTNPFAQIAETIWTLTGRDDMQWLETYIPQCRNWSDNGRTWRAAYGPRLRKWPLYSPQTGYEDSIDQIAKVYQKLEEDQDTRQAVISLWDPAEDWVEGSKDYPCNNWLHFLIRDNKVHLNVVLRSNDLIYGFSHVDFFLWSVLQEAMANWLWKDVGSMQWNASSFHLYQRHYAMARDIINTRWDIDDPYIVTRNPPITQGMTEFFKTLNYIVKIEEHFQEMGCPSIVGDGFTTACAQMLWLWRNRQDRAKVVSGLNAMHNHDFKLAAIVYLSQRHADLIAELDLVPAFYQYLWPWRAQTLQR